ncbi:MAG: DUF1738 domain-containing protein [Ignavibacteriae bacterium]|nr:DUF1738 domain-containing protein [Ignavibacteriota bacterium]
MNKNELFEKINNQILEKLNEGIVPWKKSWKEGIPSNFISKRAYHGINFLSLSMNDYSSPYYLTFKQCRERGGSIKAGSKSQMIVYWKVLEYRDEERDENIMRYPFLRYSNVFNLSQTDISIDVEERPILMSCESILDNMKCKPIIKNNISRCYYTPYEDYISVPKINDFDSSEEYYSSLFHELIHWTGHGSRVNRPSLSQLDDENYSFEELVAEIGSAYLCSLCGISPSVVENQTAYIKGWIKLSTEKDNVFLKAAKDAKTSVDFILASDKRRSS